MILVVSEASDSHAAAVLRALAVRGSHARLVDLSQFPRSAALTMRYQDGAAGAGLTMGKGPPIDLHACEVIWWRRPQPFVLDDRVQRATHRTFAYNECLEAFAGMWQTLDPLWINHPTRDEVAARKAFQLKVAQGVGLPIPRTLITNDPAAARAFAESAPDRCIYKAFSATVTEWRETRLLGARERELFDAVRYAPVIFQEYVAGTDLRITIVGDRIFPAAIHADQSRYEVDFRMDMMKARTEATTLAPDTEEKLRAFMRRLGLIYGAVDMRRTKAGQEVFLEINPSGQWLFVEGRTKQPITAAMADICLTRSPGPGRRRLPAGQRQASAAASA